ncbi:probable phospholipid-transporting ATPase Dnf3p [[Candida] jaroonii]|uniref:Probable phospholipid-transporting ATPase Dnf3p n=1 Tax=[Candida] jaroonii TaxID=467808 RepID=A0ACA9Y5V7_9ASCO|nr:probable phospholipid-transporting ATPase Dnf3p [[Candida] jaroonii]
MNEDSNPPPPNKSSNELQVPTAQVRRKRGLSLRSQLFNKTLTNRLNPIEQRSQDNIELQEYDKSDDANEQATEITRSDTPQITIDESNVIQSYEPYQRNSHNFTRSTTNLSTNSDTSSVEFLSRSKRHRKGKLLTILIDIKDKITGNKVLPPTENGRIIPLTLDPKTFIEEYGNDNVYNSSHQLIDERTDGVYVSNAITSSKYSIYSFLPKQLRAQFSKIANCYFMVVAIMQMIPSWSTTGQYTTIIPLLIFMSISIAREGFDDWKRHKHDKEENNKKCWIIKEDLDLRNFDTRSIATIITETIPVITVNSTVDQNQKSQVEDSSHSTSDLKNYNLKECKSKWRDIKVGNIIKIREDEWVPADILILSALNESDADTAFVETMALDGETNLKSKNPPAELSNILSKASGLKNFNDLVTVEDPNTDLYNFEGLINVDGETHALGPDNVIYRGSILRNTKSVLGLVIFTGEETKIRMNNIKNPRTKAPKLQRNINFIVIFMVFVVASLSAFSTMAQRLLYAENEQKAWYLYEQDAGVAATLMGFIIMYNTLIPLSLYVTMEIIKVGQLLLLQCDIDMYHKESNTPADAKTATILEELGQVNYIFSDKTGTLTDNLMLFRKFSINGMSWLHDLDLIAKGKESSIDSSEDEIEQDYVPRTSTTSFVRASMDLKSIKSVSTWKSTANPKKPQNLKSSIELLKYIQTNPNTLFSKKAKFFLLSIALCSTCLPRRNEESDDDTEDQNISYQASSPDEKALVEAARDLGFIVYDKKSNILKMKTYPQGFNSSCKFEEYEVLDVVEFSSQRKRMSIIVKFPDSRICLICKGADNVILERLKNSQMAVRKAKEISLNASERKMMEADMVLQQRFSQEAEARETRNSMSSLSSLRKSLQYGDRAHTAGTLSSIDKIMGEEEDHTDIAENFRKSLHLQQAQRYSIDIEGSPAKSSSAKVGENLDDVYDDRLLLNQEFILEKTLEHIEEFSTEGLRTLLYSFKWLDKKEYADFNEQYSAAKTALVDRSSQIETVGESIENNFELLGATAIEDKLQDGVSDAIEKLRRAGIKMWMLTGDKRETAINIGYSCRLIKDYSTVAILNIDHGKEEVKKIIVDAIKKVQGGGVAHCVVVIDGETLGVIEQDDDLFHHLIDLCIIADSAICCRASPSQKAKMVTSIREVNRKSVTLAIGDGANDIAMIQSADIGVGITGKEGLQAARASDYAIAQFRFLLKLLLVNGRYNYIRTSKFVLCTFYKELIFYLTQALYQRYTLFSGSSVYESWSLSMFNTLFTSLPVLVVGIFDKDLKPATLLAVPELYAKGRLYQAFNLKVFVSWMVLAALQSVGISFLSWHLWALTALRDNTTLPLGTLLFATLVIIINIKCEFIELQNRNWLAFAAFIISVGGYAVWNVLIMFLYRSKVAAIFYVEYGLLEFGQDVTFWASLLILFTIPLLLDILIKVFKFMIKPSDDELFKAIEKDLEMRKTFETKSFDYLSQGWTFPHQSSIWRRKCIAIINVISKKLGLNVEMEDKDTLEYRKRAGTVTNEGELPPSGDGEVIYKGDSQLSPDFEVLPSGKRVKIKRGRSGSLWDRFRNEDDNEDIEAIISDRLKGLDAQRSNNITPDSTIPH